MRWRLPAVLSLAAFVFGSVSTRATSVRPLSFDQITARADAIALVETVNARSDWRTSAQGKHIVTVVTFKVERVLKGQLGAEIQLEFLGGHIGGLVMGVDGVPEFRAGDRDVLFLSAKRASVSPVVGLFQGRFRVERDRATGTERVLTFDRQPFAASSAGLDRLLSPPASAGRSLSYPQFEALVLQIVAQAPTVKP